MARRAPTSTPFPTRRSSDLNVRSVDELLAAIRAENQRAEAYGQVNIPELMEVSAYQWQLEQLEMKLDRKSTRLNSSHLVISYAVFCLTKKRGSGVMREARKG